MSTPFETLLHVGLQYHIDEVIYNYRYHVRAIVDNYVVHRFYSRKYQKWIYSIAEIEYLALLYKTHVLKVIK